MGFGTEGSSKQTPPNKDGRADGNAISLQTPVGEANTTHRRDIDDIIKRLYEDNLSGKLSDSRFAKMNADYEQEQQILEASSADLRRAVDFCEEQTVNIKSFLKCVRKYTEPSELTPDMLHELVDKIVVHAPDKSSGHRTQQVDIYYNFVGKIPLSEEIATRQTA